MDADWLKRSVGAPLQKALTAMVVVQPKDPVEFIGAFLLQYVAQEESKEAQAALFTKATELAAKQESAATEAAAAAEAAAMAAAAGSPDEEKLLADLKGASEVSELYAKVLEVVKNSTGASGCYIGRKDLAAPAEEGAVAAPVITMIAGSDGSDVEGSMLKGVPEGADPEEVKPEGVSFALFVGTDPPEPEPVLGEDGEPVSGEGVLRLFLSMENICSPGGSLG